MKKTLIVNAHPSSKGFTFEITNAYKKAIEQKTGKVEIIDLYNDEKYQQPFLKFEVIRGEWNGNSARKLIQEKITWADEIVFVYPMWWSAMPAIMKNFIDANFTADFAFSYKTGKQEGLLKNKIVRIFVTADAPWAMYAIIKPFLKVTVSKAIFGFCGMKVKSFDIFTGMTQNRTDEARIEILEKVKKRA